MKRFILILLLLLLISGFVSAEESLGLGAIAEDYAIKALEWLESGAGWVADQVPLYVEELLNWYIFRKLVFVFVGIVILTLSIILFFIGLKSIKRGVSLFDEFTPWLTVISVMGGLISFGCIIDDFMEAMQIIIAPRVWLLEYLTSLVN